MTIEQDTSGRVVMIPYSELYDLLSESNVQDFQYLNGPFRPPMVNSTLRQTMGREP